MISYKDVLVTYQYRKSHWGDKMAFRLYHLHSGISFTGKMSSLYYLYSPVCNVSELDIYWFQHYSGTIVIVAHHGFYWGTWHVFPMCACCMLEEGDRCHCWIHYTLSLVSTAHLDQCTVLNLLDVGLSLGVTCFVIGGCLFLVWLV